jgi:hypothetical protein
MMSRSIQTDMEKFSRRLNICQSTIAGLYQSPPAGIFLNQLLDFWIDCTQFYLAELEFWDMVGDHERQHASADKVQQAIDHLNDLIALLESWQ